MSQLPHDSANEASEPNEGIRQQADNTLMSSGMQAAQGDGNIQNQGDKNTNIIINLKQQETDVELPEYLRLKSLWRKLFNYVKTLLFLFVVFITWAVLGFTATHAFPTSLTKSLLGYLFCGFGAYRGGLNNVVDQSLESIWKRIKLQINNLSTHESVASRGSKGEARELNQLDCEYWLLIAIIELLSSGIIDADKEIIDWKLSELDEQRDLILERLQPLKTKYYRWLNKFQNVWKSCYEFLTLKSVRREKEFKEIERILEHLILNYAKQEPHSREVIQEMLEALSGKTASSPRLKTLRKTGHLLNWMYQYIENLSPIIPEDPKYKEYPVRAWHESNCYHLPKGCTHYPRIEKTHGQHRRIRLFKTPEEARAKNLRLCGTCRRILK